MALTVLYVPCSLDSGLWQEPASGRRGPGVQKGDRAEAFSKAIVERIRHMSDSQRQILALAFK